MSTVFSSQNNETVLSAIVELYFTQDYLNIRFKNSTKPPNSFLLMLLVDFRINSVVHNEPSDLADPTIKPQN